MEKKFEYKILNIAGDVGEALLESGSEIYRVEANVCKVAEHFGFYPQCFATLTCIIITFENSQGEIISLVRRVKSRTTNLDKVYKVFSLVENIEKYDIEGLKFELENIKKEKQYSFLVNISGNCMGASFFSILFLGNMNDFIAAFIGGLLIALSSKLSDLLKLGTFFSNLICGFVATATACLFQATGFVPDVSIPIISTLMILVPGVSFINSMRDIFSGDLVTGMSRLMEVVMIGTSIAVGSGVALNIFFRLGGAI